MVTLAKGDEKKGERVHSYENCGFSEIIGANVHRLDKLSALQQMRSYKKLNYNSLSSP